MLRKKDSYRKKSRLHMYISQSTLNSIKTSQDDEVRINLTRLKD